MNDGVGGTVVAATKARTGTRRGAGLAALPRDSGWAALLLALFALYYGAPGVPLSLILLLLCGVVCCLRLPLAVSMVPLAMPFYMLPKHLGHEEFSLGETAIVLCAAVFVLIQGRALLTSSGVRRRVLRRLAHPTGLDLAVALFFLAATAATLAVHGVELRHLAQRKYRTDILEPLVYYVLAASTLRDARAMLRALWALAGAGLLVGLLGLGQYIFRPGTLTGATWIGDTRHAARFVSAVYGSPDNLGLLLDRAIPVAVVLGLLGLATRRVARTPWLGYLPWLALLPMAVALVLSNSRGGMIVAAAAAVAALLLWRMMKAGGLAIRRATRDRALALGGLVAALAVAGLVLVLTHHGRSTNARLLVWQSALAMIRDHPIFGVGPDNFLYYYFDPTNGIDRVHHIPSCLPDQSMLKHLPAKHYMNPLAWQEPCLSHPHNIVLDLWLTTGILGLVAFAAIVIIAGRYAWRTLRALQANGSVTKAGEQVTLARAIQIGAVVIVAATLGHGLVDNSIFLPDLAVAFWLAIAIANNLRPSAKGR